VDQFAGHRAVPGTGQHRVGSGLPVGAPAAVDALGGGHLAIHQLPQLGSQRRQRVGGGPQRGGGRRRRRTVAAQQFGRGGSAGATPARAEGRRLSVLQFQDLGGTGSGSVQRGRIIG